MEYGIVLESTLSFCSLCMQPPLSHTQTSHMSPSFNITPTQTRRVTLTHKTLNVTRNTRRDYHTLKCPSVTKH
eukprot:m.1341 g.1341  ORF g.1341 m.1341 type:complete len:73 (+) comp642_c0_seq1:168-386(+)